MASRAWRFLLVLLGHAYNCISVFFSFYWINLMHWRIIHYKQSLLFEFKMVVPPAYFIKPFFYDNLIICLSLASEWTSILVPTLHQGWILNKNKDGDLFTSTIIQKISVIKVLSCSWVWILTSFYFSNCFYPWHIYKQSSFIHFCNLWHTKFIFFS